MSEAKEVTFQFAGTIEVSDEEYFLAETEEEIIANFEKFYTTPRVYDSDEKKFVRFVKIYMTNRPTTMRCCYSPSPLVPDLCRFYDKHCQLTDCVTEWAFRVCEKTMEFPRSVKYFKEHLLWTISEFWMMTSEEFAQGVDLWSDNAVMVVKLVNNKMRRGDFREVLVDEATKLTTGLPKLDATVLVPPETPFIFERGGELVGVDAERGSQTLVLANQALCAVGRQAYDNLVQAVPDQKIGMVVRLGSQPHTIRCVDIDHNGRDSYLVSLIGGDEIDPGLEQAFWDKGMPYEYTEMMYQLPNPNANYHTPKHIPVPHIMRAIQFAVQHKSDQVWALDSEMAVSNRKASELTDDWAAIRISDGRKVHGIDTDSYQEFLHRQKGAMILVKDPAREFKIAARDDKAWLSGGFRGSEWIGFMDISPVVEGEWCIESKNRRHLASMGAGQVASRIKRKLEGMPRSTQSTSWLYDSPTFATIHSVRANMFTLISINPKRYKPHIPQLRVTMEVPWEVKREDDLWKSTAAMNKPVFPHSKVSSSSLVLGDQASYLRIMAKLQIPRVSRCRLTLLEPVYVFPNCHHVACGCHISVKYGDDICFLTVQALRSSHYMDIRARNPVLELDALHPTRNGEFIADCAQGFGDNSVIPLWSFNYETRNYEIRDENYLRQEVLMESNGEGLIAQENLRIRYKQWRAILDDPEGEIEATFDDLV